MKTWIAALLIGCLFTPCVRAQDGMLLGSDDSDHASPTGDVGPATDPVVAPPIVIAPPPPVLVTVPPSEWTTVTPEGSGWSMVTQVIDPLGWVSKPDGTKTTVVPDDVIADLPTPPTTDNIDIDLNMPIAPPPVITGTDGTAPTTDLVFTTTATPPVASNDQTPLTTPQIVGGITTCPPRPTGIDPGSIPPLPLPDGCKNGGFDFTSITIIQVIKGHGNADLASMMGGKYLSNLVDTALKIADKL